MAELPQLLVYGVVLGGIISLGAVGVSLIFGILRFAHFAHGDMMTLGAYFALMFYGALSLPMPLAFVLAMVLTALLAVILDRLIYKRLRRGQPVVLLIASVGVALMVRSAIQVFWGPDVQNYGSGIQMPWVVAGLRIKPDQVQILVGVALLVTALHLYLQKTRMGKAMRATADNMDLARLSGIDTERVVLWTWVLGAGLAAAAGIFLAMDTRLHPVMGWRLLLPVFAAAILGGIGRPYGAIAGGMVIGIAQELSTLVVSPAYKPAVAFAIMVVMLIVRPTGLFGGRQ